VLPIADNATTGTLETKLRAADARALESLCPKRVRLNCDLLHTALSRRPEVGSATGSDWRHLKRQ
jgi:hypothetical protein